MPLVSSVNHHAHRARHCYHRTICRWDAAHDRLSGPCVACALSRAGECRPRASRDRGLVHDDLRANLWRAALCIGGREGTHRRHHFSPRFDVRTLFGFRAPVEVWRKFLSADPPPLFHDFFAMLMRVPEFVLEGDGLAAMQNARALHRMMNVMRETGAPDA